MKYKKFYITMFFLIIISSFSSLVAPFFLSSIIKSGQVFNTHNIVYLLVILIVSLLIEVIVVYFREKFAMHYNVNNFKSIYENIFYQNYDVLSEKGPTSFIERAINSVNSIYLYMTGDNIKIATSLIIMAALLVLTCLNNVFTGVILFLLIPLNYGGFKLLNKELKIRSKHMQVTTANGWQEIISVSSQIDYLKQCNDYKELINFIEPKLNQIYSSMMNVNIFAQIISKLITGLNSISQIMITIILLYQFVIIDFNPAKIALFTIIIPLYISNLSYVTKANLSKNDLNIANEFIWELKNNRENDGDVVISKINSVAFNIPELRIKNKLLQRNVYLNLKKGDIVWIKGDSGKGKSTLVKALLKFREHDGIEVDGVQIGSISNNSLRNRIEYVSQNSPIIKGTLKDNLFLNTQYSSSLDIEMSKDPLLSTIIDNDSLNKNIFENGSNLSGGEKQKVALLRALSKNTDVLILDEVTSSIDSKCATEIFDRVYQKRSDLITIVISHDDFVYKYVDKIFELK